MSNGQKLRDRLQTVYNATGDVGLCNVFEALSYLLDAQDAELALLRELEAAVRAQYPHTLTTAAHNVLARLDALRPDH